MQAPHPESEPHLPEDRQVFQFGSEEEFRAWARENVADWETFVNNSLASIATVRAWREAGNPGLPPGYVRFHDYVREHPV
jgi:hypothetical protein